MSEGGMGSGKGIDGLLERAQKGIGTVRTAVQSLPGKMTELETQAKELLGVATAKIDEGLTILAERAGDFLDSDRLIANELRRRYEALMANGHLNKTEAIAAVVKKAEQLLREELKRTSRV